MLIEFKVANYRSIRDEQSLSLVASNYSDELQQNLIDMPLPGLSGTRLLKTAAIYGANASGKSNIISALRFAIGFVRNSATGKKPDSETGIQPFKLDPACEKLPTKFEIQAVVDGTRMLYGLELTRQRVTSEYLVAYPKGRAQIWFERDWDEKGKKYKWSKSSEHFHHDDALRSKVRENASFLSIAAQFNHKQSRSIWDWFQNTFHFVDEKEETSRIAELLANEKWRLLAVHALAKADLGISDAKVIKRKPDSQTEPKLLEFREHFDRALAVLMEGIGETTSFSKDMEERARFGDPQLIHRGKEGFDISMDFHFEESDGTRRFLAILGECFRDAEKGRVMIVDELEASLHPLLVREIISLFASFEFSGTRCAQLLFTTHNPLLLDQSLLRRDQIWFTEKDDEGATRLYPLTDFKPRKDEALVKGYLAGRYGGVPFIPEGLAAAK